MGISIMGTGMYLPSMIATNEDFTKLVDTSDEWITTRTGVKTRHISTGEMTWELAANAARAAIEDADIDPLSIDRVICSTVTSDYITPSCACLAANAVGAHNAVGMDINVACAGFVYALDIAERYLRDDDCKTVLVISAEEMTKITDYTDRSTCVLFGDGSGACVVKKSDNLFRSFFGGDPTGTPELFARGLPPSNPFMKDPFDLHEKDGLAETNSHFLYQNGKVVYKFATRAMPLAITTACEKAGITADELHLIIPHQANIRIIETAAKNLGLPMEKFFVNIHKYGNMSSACLPIGLNEARKEGKINKGDKFCIVGFGAGLTYGAVVLEL